MNIAENMLKLFRCPATGQPLENAGEELLTRLNDAIDSGRIKNSIGEPIVRRLDGPLDGGLVNADKTILCPIRDEIVTLVADECIELEQL